MNSQGNCDVSVMGMLFFFDIRSMMLLDYFWREMTERVKNSLLGWELR
jgi:hypothetical protein